jgi:hypothetical protein
VLQSVETEQSKSKKWKKMRKDAKEKKDRKNEKERSEKRKCKEKANSFGAAITLKIAKNSVKNETKRRFQVKRRK